MKSGGVNPRQGDQGNGFLRHWQTVILELVRAPEAQAVGPAASSLPSSEEDTDAHPSPLGSRGGIRRGPGLCVLGRPSGLLQILGVGVLWALFGQKTSLILIYLLYKDHLQFNNSESIKH